RIHPQIVLDMGDARHVLGDILGPPLVVAAVDLAGEGHLVRLDAHLDARCIERGVVAQPVAHILLDALVRAGVALRAVTAVLVLSPAPLGLLVAEPGRDLVTRLVPEVALLGAAGTIVAGVVFPSAIRLALAAATGAVRALIEGRIAPGAGRGEVIARVAARPLVVAAAVAALVIILVGVAAHLPRPFVLAHRSIVAVAIAQVVGFEILPVVTVPGGAFSRHFSVPLLGLVAVRHSLPAGCRSRGCECLPNPGEGGKVPGRRER